MTGNEIRKNNLFALRKEFGGEAGTWESLSVCARVTAKQLVQWAGDHRNIGHRSARKLESNLGKPQGWMDVAHNADGTGQLTNDIISPLEKLMLEQYRRMSPEVQMAIRDLVSVNYYNTFPERLMEGLNKATRPLTVIRGNDASDKNNVQRQRRHGAAPKGVTIAGKSRKT